MRLWVPLLVSPALALADQVIAYASVGWSCAHERAIVLHAIHAFFLVATAASLPQTLRIWRASRSRGDETARRQHFLSAMAIASVALAVFVIAAMWLTTWFIPPCVA